MVLDYDLQNPREWVRLEERKDSLLMYASYFCRVFFIPFLPPSFFLRFYYSQFSYYPLRPFFSLSFLLPSCYVSPFHLWLLPHFIVNCLHRISPFWLLVSILLGSPTNLLVARPLPLPKVCLLHHSQFQDKTSLFCFSLTLFALLEWIRIGGSLSIYLYGMHQVVQAFCLPLLGKMPSQQGIFSKRSLKRNPKIDHFSPHHQTTPFKTLDFGLTSLVLVGYRQVVHWPLYTSSTTFCIYLLSLSRHFCRSCHVSFYYVSLVSVLILRVMKGMGSRACIAFSYFSRAWTLPWQKPLSIQPLGLLHLLLLFLPCPWAYWLPFPPC